MGILSRKPLCLPTTVMVQPSVRKDCCHLKDMVPFVSSPSSQLKGSSSSAMFCHCSCVLGWHSGLSPANTWFPICVCSCMIPSSETLSELQDVRSSLLAQAVLEPESSPTPHRGAGCPCAGAATPCATGWGHCVHSCRATAGSSYAGLFQQDRHLSVPIWKCL